MKLSACFCSFRVSCCELSAGEEEGFFGFVDFLVLFFILVPFAVVLDLDLDDDADFFDLGLEVDFRGDLERTFAFK